MSFILFPSGFEINVFYNSKITVSAKLLFLLVVEGVIAVSG